MLSCPDILNWLAIRMTIKNKILTLEQKRNIIAITET